jgi:hypothetical protein
MLLALQAVPQGQVVRKFNDVVFQPRLYKVHGPVKAQFGKHLIEIMSCQSAKQC